MGSKRPVPKGLRLKCAAMALHRLPVAQWPLCGAVRLVATHFSQ